jgi:hypothetical protein
MENVSGVLRKRYVRGSNLANAAEGITMENTVRELPDSNLAAELSYEEACDWPGLAIDAESRCPSH